MGSTEGSFFAAIEAGAAEEVRAMVAAEPSLASARDEHGVSAVMRARYRSDQELLVAVLSGDPALDVFEAASLSDVERVRELLDADPSSATAYSADGFTALHFPAFFGGVACARALVERGADVDAHGRGWMTGTPLNSAAAGRHADVARLLLEGGADPDARQGSGWTPLHSAAHNGDPDMVVLLLAHGADPAATNDEGVTVLSMAEQSGNQDVMARVRDALSGA
jgi:ankyrin repeat protein